jgi:dihydroorotase
MKLQRPIDDRGKLYRKKMSKILIRNPTIVNEGKTFKGDLLIQDEIILSIGVIDQNSITRETRIIDATGLLLIPGIIDDHVHFREPGLINKGDIFSESRAAAAGGVTSFMDMPNTVPQTITLDNLKEKYRIGSEKSIVNYSFFIGATNNNLNDLMNTDPASVCGIKLFMGSSTGNMLVDDEKILREIFSKSKLLVACHCEYEPSIKKNSELFRKKYGESVPFRFHPMLRSRESCFLSSSLAVKLASEYNTRLHILHLSTADELKLFNNEMPLIEKRITSEVCIHHLWFDDTSYDELGALIKWNPAIKTSFDRKALIKGVNNNLIDTVATDHAPHTISEKSNTYFKAPSGGPMVQHSLVAMLEMYHNGLFSPEKIVEKMCHNPAILFRIKHRGFIREGYKADLCLVDPENKWTVDKANILYKCGWSPFERITFRSKVVKTFVNGNIIYDNGMINDNYRGQRLTFDIKN